MTRPAVTEIALRLKLDPYPLLEEYEERMAITTIEGGKSEKEADKIAMADVIAYAEERAKR